MRWITLPAACGEIGSLYLLVLLAWQLGAAAPPPGWLVAAVLLAATALALLLDRARPPAHAARWLAAAGVVAVVLPAALGSDHPMLMALTAAAAWWRGLAVTQYTRSHTATAGNTAALAGIALLPLVAQLISPYPGWPATAAPYYAVFFAGSLAALVLSRAERLRQQWSQRAHWRVTGPLAVLSGTGLFLVPALLGWVLTGRDLSLPGRLLGWVGSGLLNGLLWALALILAPFEWLMQLFVRWLTPTRAPPPPTDPADKPLGDLLAEVRHATPGGERAVGALAIALLVVLLFVVVLRTVRRRSQLSVDAVPEERESTLFWHRTPRPRRGAVPPAPGPSDVLDDSPTGRVRRLYRRLQQAGAAAGRPRRPVETPSEYLAALSHWGARPGVAGRITALYLAVRYGEVLPAPAEVVVLEDSATVLSIQPPSLRQRSNSDGVQKLLKS